MALRTGAFLLLCGGVCAIAQAAGDALPEEFEFHFAPPDGVHVRQDYRLVKSRHVEGTPVVRDEIDTRTEGVFRRVGDHYELSPKVTALSMLRNGKPMQEPLTALLAQVRSKYVISSEGEMLDVQGYGGIEPMLRSAFPPQLAALLSPLVNEATMVAREKADWNGRYAAFTGGTVRIGAAIDMKTPYTLPSGEEIEYTVRTVLRGWEACPSGHCVRVEQVFESDAAALGRLFDDIDRRAGEAAPVAERTPNAASTATVRISGSLSRLIDPRTMLIHAERLQRTMTFPTQVPGKGVAMAVHAEERSYAYTYR